MILKKRLMISAILAILVCFLTPQMNSYASVSASADSDLPEKETEYLSFGVYQVEISKDLSEGEKIALMELMNETEFVPEGVVIGISCMRNLPQSISITPSLFPQTILSETSLNLHNEVVCQEITESGYDSFKLSAIASWGDYTPTYQFTDVFTVAWSGGFSLYKDSVSTYYYLNGESINVSGAASRHTMTPSAAVSYKVPVKLSNLPRYLWYIQIDAYIHTLASASGTANAVCQYAHAEENVSIQYTVSYPPSISFTPIEDIQTSEPGYCDWTY